MLIGVLVVSLLAGCSGSGSTPEVVRPVKTMVVSAGEDTRVRSFPGKAEASRKAELAFQVSGLLVKLPVKEGQKIAKGEVIGQLRQDEFAARLKALQRQLDQARADLRALRLGARPEERLRLEANVRAAAAKLANARTDLQRHERLVKSLSVAQGEYELSRTNYQVAQEEYKSARQLLEEGMIARSETIEAKEAAVSGLEGRVVEAKIQLDDCTLRAPYDGVIAKRLVEQDQSVKAKQPVVQFQDVEEILVAVDVPETIMADIRSADIVQMVAEFSGVPGLHLPAQIREVAQAADPVTQTFRVRAAMMAPPGVRVLPGMTASVTLTFRRASVLGNRILVPIAAVFKDESGQQAAWIVGPDEKVTRRPVRIGEAAGSRIEVLEGLQPGDRIAVAGVTLLRDGMKV